MLACKPPGRSAALVLYLIDVIRNDSSLRIRQHVARGLSESILLSLALGEVIQGGPSGIVDTQARGSSGEQQDQQDLTIVKAVRKEFGKKPELRQAIQDALMYVGPTHKWRVHADLLS